MYNFKAVPVKTKEYIRFPKGCGPNSHWTRLTKSRPTCTEDEELYVIKNKYIIEGDFDLFIKNNARDTYWGKSLDLSYLITEVKDLFKPNVQIISKHYNNTNIIKNEKGICQGVIPEMCELYVFEEAERVTTLSAQERRNKDLRKSRDDNKRMVNALFKSAVIEIAKKYYMRYDENNCALRFTCDSDLECFINKVIKEQITKDFEEIGIKCNSAEVSHYRGEPNFKGTLIDLCNVEFLLDENEETKNE